MKKAKQVLAIALVLVLTILCASCTKASDRLAGKWALTLDVTKEVLEEDLGEGSEEIKKMIEDNDFRMVCTMIMEFKEDGTMSGYMDEASAQKLSEDFCKMLVDELVEMTYEQAAEQGITSHEEADKIWLQMNGCTIRESMEQSIDADEMKKEMLNSAEDFEGVWKANAKKLYYAEPGMQINRALFELYTLSEDGNTLTITEGSFFLDKLSDGSDYPLTLTRVS